MTQMTLGNGLSAGALILLGPAAVLTLWLIGESGGDASPLLTLSLVGVLALGALAAAALLFRWGRSI
jgi:hypothetical protein